MRYNLSSDPKINEIANNQIDYFVNKFKANANESVLRAKAVVITTKALKELNPSKGNLKTFLSSRLMQLSREMGRNSPVHVPENILLKRSIAANVIASYNDTYGRDPTPKELSKEIGVPEEMAKRLLNQSLIGTTDYHVSHTERKIDPLETVPHELRSFAEEIYISNKNIIDLAKKHGIGKTKMYEIKKRIDKHISSFSEMYNIEGF